MYGFPKGIYRHLSNRRGVRARQLAVVAAVTASAMSIPLSSAAAQPAASDELNAPIPTTAEQTVLTGNLAGLGSFSLVAYQSNQGLCLDLYVPLFNGVPGACGIQVAAASAWTGVPSACTDESCLSPPTGADVGDNVAFNAVKYEEPEVGQAVVFGPVVDKVASVSITNGVKTIGATVATSTVIGAGRYFVGTITTGLSGRSLWITAYDTEGAVLDTWTAPLSGSRDFLQDQLL